MRLDDMAARRHAAVTLDVGYRWSRGELADLVDEELEQLLDALQRVCETIEEQVTEAQFQHFDGETVDNAWFARARHALKAKRRICNTIQSLLGVRRKERQEAARRTVENEFVQQARLALPPEQFQQLLARAEAVVAAR